jgi:hypothetical protein
MSQAVEIFENEEAEKFLDYFVAFRKFSNKADYLRRLITVGSEIALPESKLHHAEADPLDSLNENQSTIGLTASYGEAESNPTRL